MNALMAMLILTAICAALAWVLALLLKVRLTPLALIGAGLFGNLFGTWLFGQVHVTDPLALTVAGAHILILATAVGVLGVLLLAKFVPVVR